MLREIGLLNPRRIFLDTCTIQAIVDCGAYIFENETILTPPDCQVLKRSDGLEIVEALQLIFLFDERAMFDWVVSDNTNKESLYPNYVRDFMEHTEICLMEDPPGPDAYRYAEILSEPYFGFLSRADKALVIDAATAGCDTFMTIEKKLVKNSKAILTRIPLHIATPQKVWELLEPQMAGL